MPRRDPRTPEGAAAALTGMHTIRSFEEGLEELFTRGLLHGTMHLSDDDSDPDPVADHGVARSAMVRGLRQFIAAGGGPLEADTVTSEKSGVTTQVEPFLHGILEASAHVRIAIPPGEVPGASGQDLTRGLGRLFASALGSRARAADARRAG